MRLRGACKSAAHFAWSLELQPVSRTFENHQLVGTLDARGRGLDGTAAGGGVLVAPQQGGGRGDLQLPRERGPRAAAGAEVGAVVVERRSQAPGSAEGSGEVLDHGSPRRGGGGGGAGTPREGGRER